MTKPAKPIAFLGSALADLRSFALEARRQAGYQLDRVQNGLDPDDWKPMTSVGADVREIRVRTSEGAFRVMYVAKFAGAVFVLHCFQKKGQRTGRDDVSLAAKRYKELVKERKRWRGNAMPASGTRLKTTRARPKA